MPPLITSPTIKVNDPYISLGLTDGQVKENRKRFGPNQFSSGKGKSFFLLVKEVIMEPMFLLLIAACVIYFVVSKYSEGIIMLIAMVFVASISFFQERRSRKALEAVKKLSQPKAKVIRNKAIAEIPSEEIVVNDILLIEEGEQVPADGILLNAHDFSVNESVLTGESFAVQKDQDSQNNMVYLGTTVGTGNAVVKVSAVGVQTMLGKLGKSIEEIKPGLSPFQKQIRAFIRIMAIIGVIAFLFVFAVNFLNTSNLLVSLLFALALAMSILPEEIPVAFSTFMALGSWRLLKESVLAKDPQVIETLGAATVICIDKTGTITENRMSVSKIFSFLDKRLYSLDTYNEQCRKVVEYAMWASEPSPFDPMEAAIHSAYQMITDIDKRNEYEMIHEYPLSGTPPVMTHIYENEKKERIIACKGGAESVIKYSNLSKEDANLVLTKVKELASEGYRVLGVASASFYGSNFPAEQKDYSWNLEGLIGLYDPPKVNIKEVLEKFYNAGIKVKIISGDYPETTSSIAKEIGFKGVEDIITGDEIVGMDDDTLKTIVLQKNIFARMFPEAKFRVINALKKNGEIVAMTGDGVNDGLALKAADIGISMGSKGTEIAKQASSIVLLNNDLAQMFIAILSGRKIYTNLKKAIRYILSIHVSILTTVIVPLLFSWRIINIFSPVHIIFFELIMGPTCSIIYEKEPAEDNLEFSTPRPVSESFLNLGELYISIIQGLFISIGVLLVYYYNMLAGLSEKEIRTFVFTTIVMANIFLTFENRSFKESIFRTIHYKNSSIILIISITVIFLTAILYIPSLRNLFQLGTLSFINLSVCLVIAAVSVLWFELYKIIKG